MTLARTLVSLGRAARADAKLGVRQPLPRAIALLTALGSAQVNRPGGVRSTGAWSYAIRPRPTS